MENWRAQSYAGMFYGAMKPKETPLYILTEMKFKKNDPCYNIANLVMDLTVKTPPLPEEGAQGSPGHMLRTASLVSKQTSK